jgi:RNA polymerase sigma-70 factor (ECF subfamily)
MVTADLLLRARAGDVFIAMPPVPFGYQGRDAVTRYCAGLFAASRRSGLVPARANGQPAFGAYLRSPAGIRHPTAFDALTLAGDQICALTRFEASVPRFSGLRQASHDRRHIHRPRL